MYPVPIETLRVRIGLDSADASRDADINAASATALTLMGSYCDRIFEQGIDVEEIFTHKRGEVLSLIRYPIVSIASVVGDDNDITEYHIAANRGLVYFDAYHTFHVTSITYTGGYAEGEFPPDLLLAYYAVFDDQFAALSGGTSSGGSEIQSVTVQDVGTVRFDTSDSSSGSEGADYLPNIASSILNNYKRYEC